VGWVKWDMVAAVSFERLDLFRTDRDRQGKRKFLTIKRADAEFERVFLAS
jgi:uncharacterized protein YifN (PemK superfamily)